MFEYEFRIFGLRRSGNHSLIYLLLSQFPDNSVFYYNDIQYPEYLFSHPSYKKSFSSRPIHSKDIQLMGDLSNKLVDKKEYELKELIKPKERMCLIQSYEDQDLSTIMDKIKIQEQRKEKSKKVFNIIVLRDYRNWLASRLTSWENTKYKNKFLEIKTNKLDLWKQYFDESQGITNFLNKPVLYHFNRMISKPKCRIKILKQLDLFKKKESWENMFINSNLNFGNGSSFSGKSLEDELKEYNNRWRKLIHNKIYQECILYKNYASISDSFFKDVKKSVESSSQISSF